MANIKSALKRIQVNERNRLQNRSYRSAVRTLIKKFFAELSAYEASPSPEAMDAVKTSMAAAYSKIDKAIKRGVLHRNTGSRQKARLAQALKRQEESAAS
ncbi:30S ribosomal protein S20 [filamentous cyanobacterium CCP5]|nr:30S ribosomal protein S20 [filamentous cyanobacterium CCP5]